MTNEEKILEMLAAMQSDINSIKKDVSLLKEDVSELKEDVSLLKEDVSLLKEEVEELRETAEITRGGVNALIEWAEDCGNAIKFPLPKIAK